MSFLPSLDIAASGINAQKRRMDTIAENIVHRETTRTEDGGPYRRKLAVFQEIDSTSSRFSSLLKNASSRRGDSKGGVKIIEIVEDQSDFIPVYDPNHPDADEDGYVMMPNVDTTVEMVDAMAATRSYNANITAFEAMKQMALKALEIGK